MLVNSSSSSNSSVLLAYLICSGSKDSQPSYIAFVVTRHIFILPLSIFILYQAVQRQRSFKSASHTDIFTYHQSVLELIWSLGTLLYVSGFILNLSPLTMSGYFFRSIIFFGETFFHILTCAERYLAVVHPITYRGLQKTHGVTIRNICIGCSWLLSWMWCYILYACFPTIPIIPFILFLVSSLVVVSFFSLCVLVALLRPGPEEGGRNKGQAKQRAFITVRVIMAVLWLWFLGYLVVFATRATSKLSDRLSCVITTSVIWFSIPSSLVLPLLYLHKHYKLPCGHPNRVKSSVRFIG